MEKFTISKFVKIDKDMDGKLKALAEIRKSSESQVIRDALVALFDKYYETLKKWKA